MSFWFKPNSALGADCTLFYADAAFKIWWDDSDNDVVFTGFVADEDLPVYYNAADLFVFPSLYEGFGFREVYRYDYRQAPEQTA